ILDFDGVIADTESLHLKAYQQVLAREGVKVSREEYFAQYLGFDDVGMLEQVARDRRLAWTDGHLTSLIARKGAAFEALVRDGDVLFPGARDFIASAAAAVPIAIASGAFAHEIIGILTAAGVRDLFAAIVGSGDTPESKPSPAPYLLAFERLRQGGGRGPRPPRPGGGRGARGGAAPAAGARGGAPGYAV